MEYQLIAPVSGQFTVIEQVLLNRGFEYSDIKHYLNTTDEDILDPNMLDNMQEGAEMLKRHIDANDPTVLIVDSDVDGFTSAAILTNYLHEVVPDFKITHVMHPGKQHGIYLDELPPNMKFVIAIDSASSDYKQHCRLQERGIDVLVIDHHEAPIVSEYACVINNQLCDYPTKSLSGAGMAYKFCCCLDKLFNAQKADNYLDLAAVGIVADMVSLKDFETKRIVEKGLHNIQNPFLQEIVARNSYNIGDDVNPVDVAFSIAPYINATIRVGTQEEKELLFKSMLDEYAFEQVPSTKRGHKAGDMEFLAEQACRTSSNIKSRQTKDRDKNLEIIENLITDEVLQDKILKVCIPYSSSCNKNLTGLIANILMDKYKRPVLLLNEVTYDDGSVHWEGSARGYEKSKLKDFRQFLLDCNLEDLGGWSQGHANAFGFSIPKERMSEYWENVKASAKDLDFSASYNVDFICRNCKPSDILEIAKYKYLWGQNVEEPKIAVEHISTANIQLLSKDKNPTLKIVLPSGIACMKFKSSEEEYENLRNKHINIVGTCERNEWKHNVTAQIKIEDYEIAEQAYF